MKEIAKHRWWLIGGCALCLVLVAMLFGADAAERQRVGHHEELLAATPRPQYERALRNNKQFQELSPEWQEHYRQLHVWVQQQERAGGGAAKALQVYEEWLKTLPPYRREQLRLTTDPQEKMALVREYLTTDERRHWRWGERSLPLLSQEELQTLMTRVEDVARLPRHEQVQLDRLEGLARYIKLVEFINDRRENPQLLRDEVINELVAALPEADRQRFQERSPDERRGRMLGTIWLNLRREARRMREEMQPTDKKLRDFLQTLDPEEQDRYLALPAEDFRKEIAEHWQRDHYKEQNLNLGIINFVPMLDPRARERLRGRDSPQGFGGPPAFRRD